MKQLRLHYLTTGQAAEALGVSRATVVRLMECGSLPYVRFKRGGWRFIKRHEFLTYQKRKLNENHAALSAT